MFLALPRFRTEYGRACACACVCTHIRGGGTSFHSLAPPATPAANRPTNRLNQPNPFRRLAVNFGLIFVLWDLKAVFYAVWQPMVWLVGYTDPRKPEGQDPLYGEPWL